VSAAATRTVDEAVRDLYNPAQLDVLRRIGLLLRSHPDPVRIPRVGVTPGADRVAAATRPPLGSTVPQRHGVHSTVITAAPPSSTNGRS